MPVQVLAIQVLAVQVLAIHVLAVEMLAQLRPVGAAVDRFLQLFFGVRRLFLGLLQGLPLRSRLQPQFFGSRLGALLLALLLAGRARRRW